MKNIFHLILSFSIMQSAASFAEDEFGIDTPLTASDDTQIIPAGWTVKFAESVGHFCRGYSSRYQNGNEVCGLDIQDSWTCSFGVHNNEDHTNPNFMPKGSTASLKSFSFSEHELPARGERPAVLLRFLSVSFNTHDGKFSGNFQCDAAFPIGDRSTTTFSKALLQEINSSTLKRITIQN